MSVEDTQWAAMESVSNSLFVSYPLCWEHIRTSSDKLWQLLFRDVGDRLMQNTFGEQDRVFANTWFETLKRYYWGARVNQHEGNRDQFSTFGDMEARLTEAEITGSVVELAIYHAKDLSQHWPDSLTWTRAQIRGKQKAIQFALRDMGR